MAAAGYDDLGKALGTDYFFLREQLSPEQLDYLTRTRRFVDDEVLQVIGGYWERAEDSTLRQAGLRSPSAAMRSG